MDTANGYSIQHRNHACNQHRIHASRHESGGEKASDALLDLASRPAEARAARRDQAMRILPTWVRRVIKIEPGRGRGDAPVEQPGPAGVIGEIE